MRYLFGFICGLAVFAAVQMSMASKEGEKVKTKASETVEATQDYAAAKKKEYETKLRAELDELSEKIRKLRSKAEAHGKEAKTGAREQLAELENKRTEASAKLEKLTTSTGKAWDTLKGGVEDAWKDLKSSYKKAAAQFNE